jgi:REP element-mobilizing transposase RayT
VKYNPDIHHRRSIRLKNYDYSCAGMYFVTICIENRDCLLGEIIDGQMHMNAAGRIVAETWQWLASQYDYIMLDEWVVMPNHIHGIIVRVPTTEPTEKHKPLGRLIGAFKTVSTKRINILRDSLSMKLWQRNYWEHIVRNEQSLQQIRQYIANNPLTWSDDQLNPTVRAVREPPLQPTTA